MCFLLREADGRKADIEKRAEAQCLAPREGLYAAVMPLAGPGDFVLEVMKDKEEVVARRRIMVAPDVAHEWVRFAKAREKVGAGEPELVVSSSPRRRWWPALDGIWPILEGEALKAARGGLPGKLAPGGLDLKIENGIFVVRSEVGLVWDQRHLLVQWWVNGKRPPPVRENQEEVDAVLRDLARPKEIRVALALPDFLGPLKPGDKVAVQVLYSPERVEYVRPPGSYARFKMPGRINRARGPDEMRTPLLSNRLEFEVTEEMLKSRETP